MIKKHYYSWADVETMCTQIVNQMYKEDWKPDYIVGITRGGNVPATIISNMTGIRCEALKVSLRDGETGKTGDSMLWMASDAFGYNEDTTGQQTKVSGSRWDPSLRKKILIVDDINDTGATFDWIKNDWQSSCLPEESSWETVWGHSVRFATLTENLASNFDLVNYSCHEVNKAEEDVWLVYPWENVGEY
jgi:hypoxanthine phosphoribosyltransferase|tara:strand:+ start:1095 stop:1664 length:570 start_codon:yes stop_codon:yes gene_type:complete